MNRKLVFALGLFVLLSSSLYVRFNSLQAKCSNGYAVAPLFTLTNIEGNIVALENLTGKIVVLDFFYPECQYSDDQIVHLEEIYEKYTKDELEIISISPKEIPIQDLEEFKTGPNRFSDLEYEMSWIIARDIETQNVTAKYNILGYPTTLIIDQDGYIRYRHEGLTEDSLLRPEIESLLPKTIYVDDGNVSGPWNGTKEHPYQNITSGLEHASDNDIVFVQNGTYYEHVTVNKSISLIGANRSNTTIDGSNIGKVVRVTANDTEIRGFTIQKAGFTPWGSDSGIYVKSSNNVITDNIIVDNNDWAIWLDSSSSNNTITFNTITNNWRGCMLKDTSGNTLVENNITDHGQDGICLWNSSQNAITDNNISDNVYGVALTSSHINNLTRNNIANNLYGVSVDSSSGNEFYHNNFIHNDQQAYFFTLGGTNSWDNGVEGNYWSNYTGDDLDPDGIGDARHVLDENNTDHFPLMGEFHKYNIWYIEPGFTLTLISNSTISNFFVAIWIEHPEYRTIYFDVAGETGYGFCRLCIPKNLMAPPYTVTIDNGQTPVTHYNETLFDNSTHRWIYFAYLHSEHQVEIIAEFLSFLILPLFMIATLLAVIVYEKRANSDRYPREK